jgi:ATP-dependent DNA helicase RecQ
MNNNNYVQIDCTIESMKILSCIKRINEKYGINIICDILKGKTTSKIQEQKFDILPTFGTMKGYSRRYIIELIKNLNELGYINYEGKYSIVTLKKDAIKVLFNKEKVY